MFFSSSLGNEVIFIFLELTIRINTTKSIWVRGVNYCLLLEWSNTVYGFVVPTATGFIIYFKTVMRWCFLFIIFNFHRVTRCVSDENNHFKSDTSVIDSLRFRIGTPCTYFLRVHCVRAAIRYGTACSALFDYSGVAY